MTTPSDADEEFRTCMTRVRQGDQAALDAILLLSEPRLRAYVDKRLGPKLKGKLRDSDVLQNAYLQILNALPQFEGDSIDAFVAWSVQIIEFDIQRQNRWFNAAKRTPPDRTSERNALARVLLDPPLTPSREMAAGEEVEQLRAAVEQLSPDHQEVLELAVFEELPHAEVARRMGRSETACRMLLFRARAALALELERADGADSGGGPK